MVKTFSRGLSPGTDILFTFPGVRINFFQHVKYVLCTQRKYVNCKSVEQKLKRSLFRFFYFSTSSTTYFLIQFKGLVSKLKFIVVDSGGSGTFRLILQTYSRLNKNIIMYLCLLLN